MTFEGKVAVVTGGGSGIGRAASLLLASRCAAVAVADIDRDAAAAVAAEVTSAGGRAVAVGVDVTDAARVRAMVAESERALGPIDVLVSNAGWDEVAPFVDTDEAFWDRVIAINFRGHLATTHAVLPGMIERGRGRIVNVASGAAYLPGASKTAYAASKAAVNRFSETLGKQLEPHGIPVFPISPGLVRTEMTEPNFPDDAPWTPPECAPRLVRALASGR
ncbi:MAG TPA: SDR family oxidoreductase, partial [Actinomycetota bacterium]|nr:SDR family oxidoreductase [Actinomycetota bacterium]